jgi:SGNH domain (fused to AT3 domains)
MTLWGCSLAPSRMRPDCLVAAEDLRAAAREAGIKTVILVNRWQKSEMTPELMVEIEVYWGEVFSRMVMVAPLPAFAALDERLVRWPRKKVLQIPVDMDAVEAFAAARKRIAGSEMQVIDAVPLFCGDRPGCAPFGVGPLFLDAESHLSAEGAKGYAARLEASGQLQGLGP